VLAFRGAVKPHLEEQCDLKGVGHISRATARFIGVGFVLGKVPVCWGVTSALFLQSIFGNDVALLASFSFKKWESGSR